MTSIQPAETPEDVAEAAASAVVSALAERQAQGGQAVLAVSATAAVVPALTCLARLWFAGPSADRIRVIQADERGVAASHPESRFGRLYRSFLSPAGIAPGHVARFWSEGEPPDLVAGWYETTVREYLGLETVGVPRIDVGLFGVEAPGTVGPLGRMVPSPSRAGAFAAVLEDGAGRLYTLTPPVVAGARRLVVICDGEETPAGLATARKAVEAAGASATWIVVKHVPGTPSGGL